MAIPAQSKMRMREQVVQTPEAFLSGLAGVVGCVESLMLPGTVTEAAHFGHWS